MTTRNRKTERTYRKLKQQRKPQSNSCKFCSVGPGHEEFIEEGEYFKVLVNLFGYSFWDEQDVEHQVMLVPKMHTESIRELPADAATEFLDFVGKYEEKGYNVYARANQNETKTVPHQHTHLIKTKGKRKKFIVFSRKPFILFMR